MALRIELFKKVLNQIRVFALSNFLNLEMKFKVQLRSYHYDADFSESCIYLSKSSLQQLKLEPGCFVEINLFKEGESKLLKTRRCKCLLDDSKDATDKVYLSSLLWFNFTNRLIGFESSEQFYVMVGH